jgi:hypothetical protein
MWRGMVDETIFSEFIEMVANGHSRNFITAPLSQIRHNVINRGFTAFFKDIENSLTRFLHEAIPQPFSTTLIIKILAVSSPIVKRPSTMLGWCTMSFSS